MKLVAVVGFNTFVFAVNGRLVCRLLKEPRYKSSQSDPRFAVKVLDASQECLLPTNKSILAHELEGDLVSQDR